MKFSSILVLVSVLSGASAQPFFTPEDCFNGFIEFGFQIDRFDLYDTYFAPDSKLTLGPAGTFEGPEHIEEYIRFADPTSPYVDSIQAINSNVTFKGWDSFTGTCQFLLMSSNQYQLNATTANGKLVNLASINRIWFELVGGDFGPHISRFTVYFPPAGEAYIFGEAFATPGTHEFICNVMVNSCPEVAALNGNPTVEECVTRLESLPSFSEGGRYDGNDQSCRVLHAAFASINDGHCPHISFEPVEDEDGKIKCQESELIETSDIFDPEDIALFEEYLLSPVTLIGTLDGYVETTEVAPPFTPDMCEAFLFLEFDVASYDRYDLFFDENSTATLAEAGTFKGPKHIQEYMTFADLDSAYILNFTNVVEADAFELTGFDPFTGQCKFLVFSTTDYIMDPATSTGERFRVSSAVTIDYSIPKNNIPAITLFFSRPYESFIFETALAGNNTRNFICETMETQCPEVYIANGNLSRADCLARLEELPVLTDGTHFDGNDLGCRALHGSFAPINPDDHCAHLSFIPFEDPEGGIRCQESAGLEPLDFFFQEELDLFAAYTLETGTGEDAFFVGTAAPTPAPPPFVPDMCLLFGGLGFDFQAYDRYTLFFNDESFVTLSRSGIYKGPEEIEEYIRFADESSPYIDSSVVIDSVFEPVGFDPVAGTCDFVVANVLDYVSNDEYADKHRWLLGTMAKLTFSIPTNTVSEIKAGFKDPFYDFFFDAVLGSDKTADYICSTMEEGCPDVYQQNGSPSRDDCIASVQELPDLTPTSNFDGNSAGCRALHAVFAKQNDKHCEHISFIPLEDYNGNIKCQETDEITLESLFTEEEIALFDSVMARNGLDPSVGFMVLDEDEPAPSPSAAPPATTPTPESTDPTPGAPTPPSSGSDMVGGMWSVLAGVAVMAF